MKSSTTNKPTKTGPRETKRDRRLRQMSEFASALLVSRTIADAAKRVGIGERQARRWMKTPEYVEQYLSLGRPQLSSIVRVLRQLAVAANEGLQQVVSDTNAAPTARVAAAKAILDSTRHFTELEELAQEVAELKRIAFGAESNL